MIRVESPRCLLTRPEHGPEPRSWPHPGKRKQETGNRNRNRTERAERAETEQKQKQNRKTENRTENRAKNRTKNRNSQTGKREPHYPKLANPGPGELLTRCSPTHSFTHSLTHDPPPTSHSLPLPLPPTRNRPPPALRPPSAGRLNKCNNLSCPLACLLAACAGVDRAGCLT